MHQRQENGSPSLRTRERQMAIGDNDVPNHAKKQQPADNGNTRVGNVAARYC